MSKMSDKQTEVLDKMVKIEQILDSGKSRYAIKELRKMMGDIKKTTKEEHDEVKSRIASAKNDTAD